MNETIALPRLAELLAAKADIDLHDAENFIRLFFAQIENVLAVAEEVNIKGLGRFTISAAEGVSFTPDNDFTEYLNQPFDMFSPIEIDDEADLQDVPVTEEDQKEPQAQQPFIEPSQIEKEEDTTSDENSKEEPQPELQSEADEAATSVEAETEPERESPTPISIYEEEPEQRNRKHIIGYIITAIVCIAIGYLLHNFIDPQSAPSVQNVTETDNIAPADSIDYTTTIVTKDSISDMPEETIKTVVTDTVTPTRFLTTMARQYYGQMEYWVFIYLANEDVLGNPNRTRPGTVVVIPQESDFTKDETRAQTLARAKRLGREIYDRYE